MQTTDPTTSNGEEESEIAYSDNGDDSDESNQENVDRPRGQPKTMPRQESQRIRGRRSHKGVKKANKRLRSRQAD